MLLSLGKKMVSICLKAHDMLFGTLRISAERVLH